MAFQVSGIGQERAVELFTLTCRFRVNIVFYQYDPATDYRGFISGSIGLSRADHL
jgi:hypothetical protein